MAYKDINNTTLNKIKNRRAIIDTKGSNIRPEVKMIHKMHIISFLKVNHKFTSKYSSRQTEESKQDPSYQSQYQ